MSGREPVRDMAIGFVLKRVSAVTSPRAGILGDEFYKSRQKMRRRFTMRDGRACAIQNRTGRPVRFWEPIDEAILFLIEHNEPIWDGTVLVTIRLTYIGRVCEIRVAEPGTDVILEHARCCR